MNPSDPYRLQRGAAALALPAAVTPEQARAQLQTVHDGLAAMQSLDDLGSPEANERAMSDMRELMKRHRDLMAILGQ